MKTTAKKYTILAVDDEVNNLGILERFLHSKYNIISATSGEEAIKIVFSGQAIDLILLDIMMPRMNGFEVVSKIKENELTRDIPFIFLTGQMDPENICRGFELGGQDYITKPYHVLELQARVATHLKLKSQQQELAEINIHLEKIVEDRTRALQQTVQEKEALILELTHRVKNMLQMSISLIQLRLRNISHAETKQAIQDFLGSLQIMSSAHNLTRNEKDLLNIPVEIFFSQLIPIIKQRFSDSEKSIEFKLNCDTLFLHFNTVIPLGLLTMDIITAILESNSKPTNTYELDICFHCNKNRKHTLEIGFKKIDISMEDIKKLPEKLQLADLFARQLNGQLNLDELKSRFLLQFAEPKLKTYNPYIEKTKAQPQFRIPKKHDQE